MAAVLAETIDYTLSHFAFEEQLMVDAGYTFSGPHKKVHEIFVRKVSEFKERFDAGEDVAEELHAMLSRWLFNHIRHDDKGFVEAVTLFKKARAASTARQHTRRGWFTRLVDNLIGVR